MLSRVVRRRAVARVAVGAVVMAAPGLAGVATASAAAGDIGYEDASYAPLGGSPTAKGAESKLWFNRGWWGVLWRPAAGEYRLARLDESTHTWSPTTAAADDRRLGRADTLWVPSSGKLYVASHSFFGDKHVAPPPPGDGARLYRYSYHPDTDSYTPDPGYPVQINDVRTETLVVDRDSTGTLWATWTYASRPYVAHTIGGDDSRWSAPYVVPGANAEPSPDDISSLVAFGGRIGVMWSNQNTKHFSFAVHRDGAGDAAADWAAEQVPLDASADDHISLKADSGGMVYAAVKTSETAAARPLIVLLVRTPDAGWTHTTFGRDSDSHTRPLVVLDEQHRLIHVYATGPQPPATSGQSGGDIVEKTTAMDNPSFLAGIGTPVIRNDGSPKLNDATSTKQSADASSGIVVLANDHVENRYWHSEEAIGGGAPAVTASFTDAPRSGRAPLKVSFTDRSGGVPTSWSWSFGDGGTSTAQNPSHVYTAPGTYDVTLTAANRGGADTVRKAAEITVTPAGRSATAPPPRGGGGGRVKVRARLRRPAVKLRGRRLTIAGVVVHGKRARLTLVFTTRHRGRRIVRRRSTRVARTGRYGLVLRLPRAARHFTKATVRLRYAGTTAVTPATRRVTLRRNGLRLRVR